MTSFDHLTSSGSVHHVVQHLGNPGTTILAGERYVTREPESPATERMAPDLLIDFNADPEAYRESNGYIISEQCKPPDFVMEIASRRTGRRDIVQKRARYAALNQYQGGMCISGVLPTTERTPRQLISPSWL